MPARTVLANIPIKMVFEYKKEKSVNLNGFYLLSNSI